MMGKLTTDVHQYMWENLIEQQEVHSISLLSYGVFL